MPDHDTRDDPQRTQRFRESALPHLDAVYTFARYLLRDATDAEDAVQECYLRALKSFDTYRGPAIRPWLFAILRNVCRVEFARRANAPMMAPETAEYDSCSQTSSWSDASDSPETQLLRRLNVVTIQRLVASLDEPFRETLVLREIHDLSYREIADIVDAPVGTVMSRLARARSMLRAAWLAEEEQSK